MKIKMLIISMLLAGCATYYKQGATDQDFYRDKTDCNASVGDARIRGALWRGIAFDECMQGKGWSQ